MAWLVGWNYRKQLYLNGTTAGNQTDYQIKVTINYGTGTDSAGNIYCGGNVNADFSDIRFTDIDGTTLLDYWIESYTPNLIAVIWIKIPSIPTGSDSAFVYLYYGNPVAPNISNGLDTFLFFDDFNRVDGPSGWTDYNTNVASVVESNLMKLNSGNTGNSASYKPFSISNNIVVNGKFKANTGGRSGFLVRATSNEANVAGALGLWLNPYGGTAGIYDNNITKASIGYAFTNNVWYRVEYSIASDYSIRAYIWQDGAAKPGVPTVTAGAFVPSASGTNFRIIDNGNLNEIHYYDDVHIRKYASPEPTWGSIGTGSASISSTPSGAEIYLNGVDQGVTTTTPPGTTISNLPPDTYDILLRLAGYADWRGIATVNSDATTPVAATIIQPQWLTNWNYRKQLYINGTIAGYQASYQMKITVNYGSGVDSSGNIYCNNNVNADFSDMRFTDTDGTTLLNYWIESYTPSSSATVWINVPSIIIGNNSTHIYLYYGNPAALNISNGSNTFLFFDDFNRPNGPSGWTDYNTNVASVVESNLMKMSSGTSGNSTSYKPFTISNNIIVNGKFKANTGGRSGFYVKATSNGAANEGALGLWMDAYGSQASTGIYDNNIAKASFTYILTNNVWYQIEYSIANDYSINAYVWQDGTAKPSVPTATVGAFVPTASGANFRIVDNGNYNEIHYYDDIRVRRYASPEPAWGSIGTEELSGAPICPSGLKYEGDTIYLSATPKDGTGPYYVEFRKNNAPISSSSGVIENTEVIYNYILTNEDIRTATLGTINFSVYIEDSCPTTHQTCTQVCTVNIGCIAPVCNFTVT